MAKPTKPSIKAPVIEPAYEDPPPELPPGEAPDLSLMETEPPEPELPPPPIVQPNVPGPAWFRVTKAGRFYVDGSVATLALDSYVSESTHDINALRQAGILLEPAEGPQRPRDAYGEAIS